MSALVAAALVLGAPDAFAQVPAFPGAEGFGARALGGRGGDVYYVTNLDDDGPGSLRYGITSATGPRTILFRVSGNIRLKSNLVVDRPRITVAGQTAPGDGICIRDGTLSIAADDVIVRHLRCRLGTNNLVQDDALNVLAGRNIIIDHCSASWSVDEVLSVVGRAENVTVQWCFITESLNRSIHAKGAHGFGSLIRSRANAFNTFHHNLFAHNNSRNPRPGTYASTYVQRLDFRNNVIYNWGGKAGYDDTIDAVELNYVCNYLIAGPSTKWLQSAFDAGGPGTRIYQRGNRFDVNTNGIADGVDIGWDMFGGNYTKAHKPFAAPPVATDPASVALLRVLTHAGALPWRRDQVDRRVANSVFTQTGQIIDDTVQVGGWPELKSDPAPDDTDTDGMPDFWELAVGSDPRRPDNNADPDGDGYTNLEDYLNWLAGPHAVTGSNTPTEIDLVALNGDPETELVFRVADGRNGRVRLLQD
ncbi:MAG: hypothetical protein RMH97_04720, partial [Verrucomicrobiales bacterium]|nr:hypothetical protein [Verrucomicrobiales bacterium]